MFKFILCSVLLVSASFASAMANLTASPSFISFSAPTPGGVNIPQFQYVNIINFSSTDTAQSVYVNSGCFGDFFVHAGCFGDLPPGGSCMIQVNYNPDPNFNFGPNFCTIHVSGQNANSVSIQVQAF